jgi:ATP-binding cassette, subfamily G (WHITE), eye pigment precursor transporter
MNMMSIEAYEVDAEDQEELRKRRTEVEDSYKKKIDMLSSQYENSEFRCDFESVHPEAKPLQKHDENNYKAGICKQYCLLLQRGFRNILRLPLTSYFRIIAIIFIALLIVLVFGQLDTDAQSIQSRNGVLYFITISAVMNHVQGVILIFPEEKPVFFREHGNRMYSSLIYFAAVVTAGLPNVFIFSTLSTLIYYFAVDLNTTSSERYFIHYGYHFLLSNSATGLGYIIGALFNDKRLAVGMLPVILLPFMLVGGFFVNQNNFVVVLLPFEYCSLFKYGFQVFTQNEYENLELD